MLGKLLKNELNHSGRYLVTIYSVTAAVIAFIALFALIIWLIIAPILFVYIEDEETMDCAFDYLLPLLCLYFCMSVSCVLGGILNAEGKAKLYTGILFTSVLANIGFGYLFVETMDMGMFGNGLSTALGSLSPCS
jgi:Na+-driven multidrug efflux pump